MPGKRILIVEDEYVVAEELRQTLIRAGYDIVGVAHSGEDALTEGVRTSPDLVLMDIALTGQLDGISAAEHLQSLGVPVIYLTAYADQHLIDRAQRTEPLAYVVKPAKSGELAAVIQLALFKRQEEKNRWPDSKQALAGSPQATEQFLRMVARIAAYSIFTLDFNGRISSWNQGAENANGYSPRQILGKSYELLFTPEDRQRNVPQAELEIAGRLGVADDTRWLVRQDGRRYWADGTLNAILDDDGVVTGFTKITRDLTEQKEMQDALLHSEQRLRVALHAARMGTWEWNIRTDADFLDDNLCKLFGISPEQGPKTITEFFALLHPEDRSRVQASFEYTRDQGVHLDTEFRRIRPDGAERWFIDQGEVLCDELGQPQYLVGACVDITERKQAEQSLGQSEERFRLFVNNVHDYALFQTDEAGIIVSWNSGAERLLGYKAEEIVGRPCARIFVPEDIDAGHPERERIEAVTFGKSLDERWHLRKDGTRFWCSGVMTAVYGETGQLHGFAKVMRDETERRNADQALKASLREKEVLLKEIHHRVKNNLQVISSLLALQSGAVENATVRGMFDEASNRVHSIGEIHELLYRSTDLARVDFAIYLQRLAQHLLAFYALDPARVQVQVFADTDLAIEEALPCGLIVNELLTNCLKHAFPGSRTGSVKITMRCGAGQCVLAVADDGVGLPSGYSFETSSSLGLKLVSVLGKQLRGHLHLDRQGGTRVTISFPEPEGRL